MPLNIAVSKKGSKSTLHAHTCSYARHTNCERKATILQAVYGFSKIFVLTFKGWWNISVASVYNNYFI